MKKFLQIALVLVVSLCYVTNVNAASKEDIINYATKYGTTAQANLVKSYFAENTVSPEVGDQLIQKAEQIRNIINGADPTKLSTDKKVKIRRIATEAAALAGGRYDYNPTTKMITVYGPNGKNYGSVLVVESNKLAPTGADYTVYIAVSGLALVLAATALYRKLKENA